MYNSIGKEVAEKMRFIARLAIVFVAAGIIPGAAAAIKECERHFLARDYKQALSACRRAAEQGHAEAQYDLGYMYDTGAGMPENDSEAVKWYRRAAEQGFGIAQSVLATLSITNGGTAPVQSVK